MVISRKYGSKGSFSDFVLTEGEVAALHKAKAIMERIELELERIEKAESTVGAAIYALDKVENSILDTGYYRVK